MINDYKKAFINTCAGNHRGTIFSPPHPPNWAYWPHDTHLDYFLDVLG